VSKTSHRLIEENKDRRVTHNFLCVLTHLGVYDHFDLLVYAADMMQVETFNRSIISSAVT